MALVHANINNNNAASQFYQLRQMVATTIVVALLVCDKISISVQQQQQQQSITTSTSFNGNSNHNYNDDDDLADGGADSELSRQLNLSGKRLAMAEHEDYRRTRSSPVDEWPTTAPRQDCEHRVIARQQQQRQPQVKLASETNHQFISVLNNQSNIITSPSLADLINADQSAAPTAGRFRPESDPHLRGEEMSAPKVFAQNGTYHQSMDGQPAIGLTLELDQTFSTNSTIAQRRQHPPGGQTYRKLRGKKRKKNRFSPPAKDNNNDLSVHSDILHRRPWDRLAADQRTVLDYINHPSSSFNATTTQREGDLLKQQQKLIQPPSGELLVASSSQPTNEFETTMILKSTTSQPDPIVASNDASGGGGGGGLGDITGINNDIIVGTGSDTGDDDDDDDDQDDGHDHDRKSFRDFARPNLQTVVDRNMDPPTSATTTPTPETANASTGTTTTTTLRPTSMHPAPTTAAAAEQELLVGPFKSEADAPATITLSGIVYQKSGVRSSMATTSNLPLRTSSTGSVQYPAPYGSAVLGAAGKLAAASPPPFESENLSTSDSSASSISSSSTTTTNPSTILRQQAGLRAPSIGAALDGLTSGAVAAPDRIRPSSASIIFQSHRPLSSSSSSSSHSSDNKLTSGSTKGSAGSLSIDTSGLRMAPPSSRQQQQQLLMNDYYYKQLGDSLTASTSSPTFVSGPTAGLILAPPDEPQQQPATTMLADGWTLLSDGGLEQAASGRHSQHKHSSKQSKHQQPVVIVQKDVKPVKYHLMRAYLKLRRLLRPYEATYVFMNR